MTRQARSRAMPMPIGITSRSFWNSATCARWPCSSARTRSKKRALRMASAANGASASVDSTSFGPNASGSARSTEKSPNTSSPATSGTPIQLRTWAAPSWTTHSGSAARRR